MNIKLGIHKFLPKSTKNPKEYFMELPTFDKFLNEKQDPVILDPSMKTSEMYQILASQKNVDSRELAREVESLGGSTKPEKLDRLGMDADFEVRTFLMGVADRLREEGKWVRR